MWSFGILVPNGQLRQNDLDRTEKKTTTKKQDIIIFKYSVPFYSKFQIVKINALWTFYRI